VGVIAVSSKDAADVSRAFGPVMLIALDVGRPSSLLNGSGDHEVFSGAMNKFPSRSPGFAKMGDERSRRRLSPG